MLSWYTSVIKKYAVFQGRSGRKEYWLFSLINISILCCLAALEHYLSIPGLSFIYLLAVLLPVIGVTIRRLHDINRRGYWMLITAIPLIGSIIFFIFMLLESTPGENRFGAIPS